MSVRLPKRHSIRPASRVTDPVRCAVPPHILRAIIESGAASPVQKERAWQSLTASEQTREQRQAVSRTAVQGAITSAQKQRIVYDAQSRENLPGVLARTEGGDPTGDLAVDEAYDGSGDTYDMYLSEYERNSVDDRGMPLISTVHFGDSYDNAFWNGQQMVYGDGDEDLPEADRLFNRFTISLEIVGHELTHGVNQYEADLAYRSQSGALNESFADVLGVLVKQRKLNQTAEEANWLIGEGLLGTNVKGVALRSMKDPGTAYDDPVLGTDPQPGHMDQYQRLPNWYDHGGVHINSGIPNHAFYYVATAISGHAWQAAGRIWYITLRDRLRRNSDFQDAANLTFGVAGDLYGTSSEEQKAVQTGWEAVGIGIDTKGGRR